ncbi:hypothetical protein NL676_039704 [Syzygium grande]|nr:hypothetical protein NL676_039704 [Syzygium grande]
MMVSRAANASARASEPCHKRERAAMLSKIGPPPYLGFAKSEVCVQSPAIVGHYRVPALDSLPFGRVSFWPIRRISPPRSLPSPDRDNAVAAVSCSGDNAAISKAFLEAILAASWSGADLLGPLLPAVSEMCTDFNPSIDVEPSLLKTLNAAVRLQMDAVLVILYHSHSTVAKNESLSSRHVSPGPHPVRHLPLAPPASLSSWIIFLLSPPPPKSLSPPGSTLRARAPSDASDIASDSDAADADASTLRAPAALGLADADTLRLRLRLDSLCTCRRRRRRRRPSPSRRLRLRESDTARVRVPELELELASGTLGGVVTAVEGLISKINENSGISLDSSINHSSNPSC